MKSDQIVKNEIRAELNYFHMSPRKVRNVAKLLPGLKVDVAEKKLLYLNKKAALALRKLLKSAITNAKNKGFDENALVIKSVIVNEGPKYKRYRPDTQGRIKLITKRTSHIKLILTTNG